MEARLIELITELEQTNKWTPTDPESLRNKDIVFGIEEGLYTDSRTTEDGSLIYGRRYNESDSPYYYGRTLQDILTREYLEIKCEDRWYRVAVRNKKVKTIVANAYVGD